MQRMRRGQKSINFKIARNKTVTKNAKKGKK